jgi:hypothetical protein
VSVRFFLLSCCLLSASLLACKRDQGGSQRDKSPAQGHGVKDGRVCSDQIPCGADAYCAFTPGLCGKGPVSGSCRKRPAACGADYQPVCACDGEVYDNACKAQLAGHDLAVAGGCQERVPDYAACGAHYCDARESYCEIYLSDVMELPTDHFCRPLPEACKPNGKTAPSCGCFPRATPCLSFCGPLLTGGLAAFHLTCQGKRPPHDR